MVCRCSVAWPLLSDAIGTVNAPAKLAAVTGTPQEKIARPAGAKGARIDKHLAKLAESSKGRARDHVAKLTSKKQCKERRVAVKK